MVTIRTITQLSQVPAVKCHVAVRAQRENEAPLQVRGPRGLTQPAPAAGAPRASTQGLGAAPGPLALD